MFGDERAHQLGTAAVLRDRRHDKPALQLALQSLQRGHLAQTGLAPGGPQVDDDRLALEVGEIHRLAIHIGKAHRRCWLRRVSRDKLADLQVFFAGGHGRRDPEQEHDTQGAERHEQIVGVAAFAAGPAAIMRRINASIDFDKRLYAEDIAGSKAHCAMLVAQNIISPEDGAAIAAGLDRIKGEIDAGEFVFSEANEDIHLNVEARLAELIGPTAGRLHTARSRNDQVALDFRLWVRGAIDRADAALRDLQEALIDQAEAHADTVMPGFTHLQIAQPVTFGHHLLAYVEMLGRDRGRLADCRRRLNENPLGSRRHWPAPPFRSTAARRRRRSASIGRRPTRSMPLPTGILRSNFCRRRRSPGRICRGLPRKS